MRIANSVVNSKTYIRSMNSFAELNFRETGLLIRRSRAVCYSENERGW